MSEQAPGADEPWLTGGPGVSDDLEPASPAGEAGGPSVPDGVPFETAASEQPPDDLSVEDLLAERNSYRDLAQRVQAEFANYRKQAQRRTAEEVDRESGQVVERLLPALDACEAAIRHGVDGADGIMSALLSALRPAGFEAMESEGKPFDPTEHEAVMHEAAADHGEPVVSEVLRTGYRWKGRVLRPAMVKVKG